MLRVVGLTLLLVGFAFSLPRVERSTCTDVYIWIADGSVDCHYLYTPSFWGVHNKPNYYCNDYVLTDCCMTCKKLREQGVVD